MVTSKFFIQDGLFFKQQCAKYVTLKGTSMQSHPDIISNIKWHKMLLCLRNIVLDSACTPGNCVYRHGWRNLFQSGGHKCTIKKIIANFVVWIGNCDVTSIEIWRHSIYTIRRSKLHYFRQNYTTVKKYRWTTWNWNGLLQGRPRSSASLGLIIRFILNKTVQRLRHLNFCLLSFWLALSLPCDQGRS